MELSGKQVDQLIEAVVGEAQQACRYSGKFIGDHLEAGDYKNGYLTACERLGETSIIADHIARHRDRILAAVDPGNDVQQLIRDSIINCGEKTINYAPVSKIEDSQLVSEAPLSMRLKNVLLKEGFKTMKDVKSLSRNDYLRLRNGGRITLNELEEYLGHSLAVVVN